MNLGRKILLVLLILLIFIAAGLIITKWSSITRKEAPPGIQEVPQETRSVTLYFVSKDAEGLLYETRDIAVREGVEEQVKAVIEALISGSRDDDKISSIPEGTEILQVFWEEDSRTIFLDFNRVLISHHPGGGTSEYYTINTIVKTIAANFPQVRLLQFLVDGYPVETISGHYAVGKPLDVMRWR